MAGISPSNDLDTLRRVALYSSLLALAIAFAANTVYFSAFGWDIEAGFYGDPAAILGRGAGAASLLRWGVIGDVFYGYLLWVPLALFLHRRLRPTKPWLADLGTIGALAYIFVGAAGAAMLATAGSSLVEAYATALPQDRAAIATSFDVLRNVVFFGLWQTLDPITAGTWVASVGWLLLDVRRVLGRLLIMVAIGLFGLSLMTMLGIHSLAALAVDALVVVLAWAGWVIVDRGRPSARSETRPA